MSEGRCEFWVKLWSGPGCEFLNCLNYIWIKYLVMCRQWKRISIHLNALLKWSIMEIETTAMAAFHRWPWVSYIVAKIQVSFGILQVVLLWHHYFNQDGDSHGRMTCKETTCIGDIVFLANNLIQAISRFILLTHLLYFNTRCCRSKPVHRSRILPWLLLFCGGRRLCNNMRQ